MSKIQPEQGFLAIFSVKKSDWIMILIILTTSIHSRNKIVLFPEYMPKAAGTIYFG
jgi:hypothetical protein